MTVVGLALVALFVTMSSISLSAEQRIERDLYRRDLRATVILPVDETRRAAVLQQITALTDSDDVSDVIIERRALELDIEGSAVTRSVGFASDERLDAVYPPDRYSVVAGRWANQTGEITVSTALAERVRVDIGDVVAAANGARDFTVVGIAQDRFYRDRAAFWTTSATIDALPWQQLADAGSRAQLDLYVYANATDSLALGERFIASSEPTDEGFLVEYAVQYPSLFTGWIDSAPATYRYPSITVVVLATMAAVAFARRDRRRRVDTMTAVGADTRPAGLAFDVAGVVHLIGGLLVGAAGGVVVGLAVRTWLGRGRVLSPFPAPAMEVVRLCALVALAWLALVLAALVVDSRTRTRRARHRLDPRSMTRLRRASLGVIMVVVIGRALATIDVSTAAALAAPTALLAVLVVPETFRLLGRRTPRGTVERLALRRVLADAARSVTLASLLAVLIGGALAYGVLVTSAVASAEALAVPTVQPGQIVLISPTGGSGDMPPAALVTAVTEAVPDTARMVVISDVSDRPGVGGGLVALDEPGTGAVMAVESIEDAAALSTTLTTSDLAALDEGAVLTWAGPTTGRIIITGSGPVAIQAEIADFNASFRDVFRYSSLMLTRTARAAGLDPRPTYVVATGLTDQQVDTARDAGVRAGYDLNLIRTYRPPDTQGTPFGVIVGLWGLCALLAVLAGHAAHVHAHGLRAPSASLLCLGVSPRWAKKVAALQYAACMAVAVVTCVVTMVGPIILIIARSERLVLDIGWTVIGLVFVAVVAAAAVGTSVGLRGVDPAERIVR